MTALRLTAALDAVAQYAVPRHPAPCDLDLSGTELPPLDASALAGTLGAAANMAGYPDVTPLAERLAARFSLATDRVLVTTGSDDALVRAFRIALEPGREALLTDPTFEMLPRFARLTGATVRTVPWPGAVFPVDAMIAAITPATGALAVVTPNNPTGAVATATELRRLALAAPQALLVVDCAYAEFADRDPTPELLDLPNVVVTRTFSKAWGLPALRIGVALGGAGVIAAMRRAGIPYPASAPAVAAACATLDTAQAPMERRVAAIRSARERLSATMDRNGLQPITSQADFVCTASPRARWLRDGLAGLGVAARWLPGTPDRIRITTPVDDAQLARLTQAIDTAMQPEAILFDLDGVLADVSGSYRATIIATAARFGAAVTADQVAARKAAGDANDDWRVTRDLIVANGTDAALDEVTHAFEAIYQGSETSPGLRATETLIPSREWLRQLATRMPLGVVTGRPRTDAERFLSEQQVADCFAAVICREDAPLKPDPAPVQLALKMLGVRRAWMIGDTPDDLRAARAAGVVPIGIPAPGDTSATTRDALAATGAARVLASLEDLDACLP